MKEEFLDHLIEIKSQNAAILINQENQDKLLAEMKSDVKIHSKEISKIKGQVGAIKWVVGVVMAVASTTLAWIKMIKGS